MQHSFGEKMANGYSWESGIVIALPKIAKINVEYQPLISAGDGDALEVLVMEKIDSAPGDLAFFMPAYKSFVKRKDFDRAGVLLQLHVDALRGAKELVAEQTLCGAMLEIWPDCACARDALWFHIRQLYTDCPNKNKIERFLDASHCSGLSALHVYERWLRYDEGCTVYMPSRGVGRVREINLTLSVVRIVFEDNSPMSCKIDEAERLAQSLPKEHFFAKKLDEKEKLVALAQSDPSQLLALLFTDIKKTVTSVELRAMLGGIVTDAQWSSWWQRARKDARLVVGSGTKPDIAWNDSADAATASILAQFSKASAYVKLDMLKKYTARSPELSLQMRDALVKVANDAIAAHPALSLEIALDFSQHVGMQSATLSFQISDILCRADCTTVVALIKDKNLRKKAIALVREQRDTWPQVYAELLTDEADTQTIALLYDTLRSNASENNTQNDVVDKIVSQTLADPSMSPRFYLWLCREMMTRPELVMRADASFVLSLLRRLSNPSFKGIHAALRSLFDIGESGDRAVAALGAEDAARVLVELTHDTGLEDYRRDRLREEIYHIHPQLHEKKIVLTYVTKEVLDEKRAELQNLVHVELPRNSIEIQRTREFGDLRENFEYHAARARQEMLSLRAKSLNDELNQMRAIDASMVDTSKISIGTKVSLHECDAPQKVLVLSILGPWDSDPSKNFLSYTSAAGTALLGAAPGSVVAYNAKKYSVDKIELWCA